MHRTTLTILTITLLFISANTLAGTIYTWTDADGVKRYSNSQPPEDAENVESIQEIQYDEQQANQQRQAFDTMVEEAGEEADRHFEQQADKKAREAEERRQAELDERTRQIIEEQARLRQEIARIENRGLSTTFTMGMKEQQIEQIKKKIAELEGQIPRSQ